MSITDELPDTVTSMEMVTCAGITYRQLDNWTRQGWLRSDERPKPKTGYPRSYPESELDVAFRMGQLTKAGLIASTAAKVARSGEANTEAILSAIDRADNKTLCQAEGTNRDEH
jgi:hypothetical protein